MSTSSCVDVVKVGDDTWEVRVKEEASNKEARVLGTFTNMSFLDLFVEALEKLCKQGVRPNDQAA